MRTLVLFIFGVFTANFIFTLVYLANSEYPRTDERYIGFDAARAIVHLGIMFWSGIVLWW